MDTSTLHTATEEFAALLSEVTQGDLRRRTQCASRDVGDLYLHLMDQNIRVAAALASESDSQGHRTDPMDRLALGTSLDFYGGGLEVGYRQTAQVMESAFASETAGDRLCQMAGLKEDIEVADLYEMQLSNTIIHTWDIAQVLGFAYQPPSEVAWRVLRTMLSRPTGHTEGRLPSFNGSDIIECVLKLSGRT